MSKYLITGTKRYNASNKTKLVCGLLLGTVLTSASAFAQETNAAGTADNNMGQLQEIVVTAQRRSENVQNVPIAISAFSGASLKSGGVTSVLDLGHADPSLQANFNQGVAYPFLRGIGNIAAGVVGNESSVAVYVDDMYFTRLFSSIVGLNSIERVEVLKGPQGTLFGRNASGGAIQMFTKDPGQETEVEASIGYANYNKWSGQFYLSAPLSDTLSWNIAAGGSDQSDGWGRSILNGQKEYLGKSWTVRSKLIWEPTDTTRIKIVGFYAYQKDDFGQPHDWLKGTFGGTTNVYGTPFPDTSIPAFPGYPNPPTISPSLADSGGFYNSRFAFKNQTEFDTYGGSLRIDQEVGFGDLVSITGFKNSDGHVQNQINFNSPTWLSLPFTVPDHQFTQELQIKSKPDSSIKWILGAFYMHYFAGYNPGQFRGDLLDLFVAPGATQDVYGLQTIDSYSAFGQTTVPLGESTNLTAGLRYTNDKLKGKGEQFVNIPSVGTIQLGTTYNNRKTFQRVTWKAAIDHHLSRDVMVYASYSRGYKAGTYNTVPLVADPARPEIVDAYELGFKSELFDRRVRLNGALFWSEIKDPQVLTVIGSPPTASVALINAQKARTRGVELGVTAAAAEGLEVRANVTYLDAEYTKFINAPHFEGGTPGSIYPVLYGPSDVNNPAVFPTTLDASGYTLPNSPKWRFDIGANYAVDAQIGRFVADVGVSYSGRYDWGTTYQDSGVSQKPVTLVNASLTFTPAALSNVSFSVWGKNIGDVQHYAFSESNTFGFGVGGWRAVAAPPRTYGGTISVKY